MDHIKKQLILSLIPFHDSFKSKNIPRRSSGSFKMIRIDLKIYIIIVMILIPEHTNINPVQGLNIRIPPKNRNIYIK